LGSGRYNQSDAWTVSTLIVPPSNAGWSSPVAREAHNLEVAGSNPVPAIFEEAPDRETAISGVFFFWLCFNRIPADDAVLAEFFEATAIVPAYCFASNGCSVNDAGGTTACCSCSEAAVE
jgi:hypothetical protein